MTPLPLASLALRFLKSLRQCLITYLSVSFWLWPGLPEDIAASDSEGLASALSGCPRLWTRICNCQALHMLYLDLLILRLYNLWSKNNYLVIATVHKTGARFSIIGVLYICWRNVSVSAALFLPWPKSPWIFLAGEFATWLFWFYGCADTMACDDVLVFARGLLPHQVRSVWQQTVIKSDKNV